MTSPRPHPAGANASAAAQPLALTVEELQAALARPAQPLPAGGLRRPRALALALVAVAGLAVAGSAALSRQQTAGNSAASAPATPPPALPAAVHGSSAPDDLPPGSGGADIAGSQESSGLLVTPPQGVVWELFEGVAVPTSRAHGPSRAQGPVQSGFSRTPTGALLAAAQIGVRRIVTPDIEDARTVNEQQLLPGPGRTAFLNLISEQQDNSPPAGGFTQYAGFQMLAFTPEVAVMSLATRSRGGALQASTITVRWDGGDWKVELPASGLEQPRVLADLAGFVPWSGVS